MAIGAVITYWVNVRLRRRTYVEDLFNQAIAAVAPMQASTTSQRSDGQGTSMIRSTQN